jgi:hypothetical protein
LKSVTVAAMFLASALLLLSSSVYAQLTDKTQTTPHVPGSAIEKSLEDQIGAGQGDIMTPRSSYYLIARDPARAIRRGRQLFQRKFTASQGLGPRVNEDSSDHPGNIHTNPAFGAGLVDSCAGCHGRPRGSAGFGGDVVTRPDSRDAPHLFGLGLKEMLGDEITSDLRGIRKNAIDETRRTRRSVTKQLVSKGIKYGFIKAFPNGSIDTSDVEGVDPDLRVRPFFFHGGEFSIRAFAVGAFKDEMGLETVDPILCAATDPANPERQESASGLVFDHTLDKIKRPPTCSSEDNDGDRVPDEIDAALLDFMEFYLLNYFKPGTGEMNSFTEREGPRLLDQIDCTNCHIQNLTVNKDRRVADVETKFDPQRGIFNRLFATATTLFTVVRDDQRYPLLRPNQDSFVVRNFFSDLKRHDLGPAFHERNYNGTLQTKFLTTPLWGVGSTGPYGHDGRSINLKEVILRHGGEARSSRDQFARLRSSEQQIILDYLSALILFPPDDTASTLNPGVPGTNNPQDPEEHGSIALGALFQIPEEGPE